MCVSVCVYYCICEIETCMVECVVGVRVHDVSVCTYIGTSYSEKQ